MLKKSKKQRVSATSPLSEFDCQVFSKILDNQLNALPVHDVSRFFESKAEEFKERITRYKSTMEVSFLRLPCSM